MWRKRLEIWGQCGNRGSCLKKKDKGQWNSLSANSLCLAPQVSLTSLNTLLWLSKSLRCMLLNSDFSWLSLQQGAVRDYHILKKIFFYLPLSIERGAWKSQWKCVDFDALLCSYCYNLNYQESLHEFKVRKPHNLTSITMQGFYTRRSRYLCITSNSDSCCRLICDMIRSKPHVVVDWLAREKLPCAVC